VLFRRRYEAVGTVGEVVEPKFEDSPIPESRRRKSHPLPIAQDGYHAVGLEAPKGLIQVMQ
jgi:hypothetical protein